MDLSKEPEELLKDLSKVLMDTSKVLGKACVASQKNGSAKAIQSQDLSSSDKSRHRAKGLLQWATKQLALLLLATK